MSTKKPRSALVTGIVRLPYRIETQFRRHLPRWLFQPRYCLMLCLSTAQPLVQDLEGTNHIRFRWANEAELASLQQDIGAASLSKRLGEQHRAAVLLVNQQVAAVAWFAKNRYHDEETEVAITLEPHQAWLYSAYVYRQHRERGHYRRLISAAVEELRREGISEILLTVDATNFVSQAAHRSLGACWIGTLWGGHCCGSSWYRISRWS